MDLLRIEEKRREKKKRNRSELRGGPTPIQCKIGCFCEFGFRGFGGQREKKSFDF